ncbi:MAG: GTPase-associated system all-helical protein GASH [Bryobacteraceae bacterium]
MQSEILQKFLDRGLLDLGEDNNKFDYVTSAAADLANNLKEDRRKLVRGSSILVGGTLDEREPLLESCAAAIKEHWPTYRGRFGSNTTQLFRAALLQAISNVTRDESTLDYAAIVFYTNCGLEPYLTAENEDDIFRDFLEPLGNTVETEAVRLWGSSKGLGAPAVQYGEVGLAPANIDEKLLKEALKAAAGNTGTNPNPHGIGNAEWLEHFGQNAAKAISASLAPVLQDLVSKVIGQTRTDDKASLAGINDIINKLRSDNHSAEILYWKESLFSPARSTSYRRMSADAAVYWAAWDLLNLVPRLHPVSVEYFLRETIRTAIGQDEATSELTSVDFCQALARTPESIGLWHEIIPGQRLTLLDAVQASATGQMDVQTAAGRTGLPHKSLIPREELAVWLFRDMQVSRLVGGQ